MFIINNNSNAKKKKCKIKKNKIWMFVYIKYIQIYDFKERNGKKVKEDKKTEKVNKKETEKMSKEEKKAKKAVEKSSKKEKKQKAQKEKKPNKFIETIKKKWLINGTKTFILVVIILAVFVGISVLMKKLNLTPIDLTEDKLFTLTSESKDKVKDIDKDINIYFVGYSDDDSTLDLAKQYTKVNEKIKVEAVTQDSRPDLVQKYGIETSSEGIIVECGDNYKVLASSDLYTHDSTTYESVNVAEEKLTAAIRSVSVEELPKVYFLSGYSSFTLTSGMQYLNMYLQNEVNQVETLDILSTGKVPDDCSTLVIASPEKDFDDVATNAITEYINKGGNILWLNAAIAKQLDLLNVNKILALYGVKPFEIGIIRETDSSKMVSNSPDLIMPEIQYADATNKLYDSEGVIFINATKINVASDEELESLDTTKTALVKTSEKAYFRTNFENQSNSAQDGEETGEFLVGAQFDKVVTKADEENNTKEVKSKLIIYGENYFVSVYQLTQSTQTPMIAYRQNKDLVLNSIAYLADREEDITVRKSTGAVTYTATEQENKIILAIITFVPLLIIVIGIIVWANRRRKK